MAFACFALLLGVGCETSTNEKNVQKALVSLAEVRRLVDDAAKSKDANLLLLVDPRAKVDFDQGHIPGAKNVLLGDIPFDRRTIEDIGQRRPLDPMFKRAKHVIVYGKNPASPSGRAMTKRLLSLGVSSTQFFAGGLEEWVGAGGELETVDATPATAEPGKRE
jgi:3-mercaptopyruvate sulfurtransferase SseA